MIIKWISDVDETTLHECRIPDEVGQIMIEEIGSDPVTLIAAVMNSITYVDEGRVNQANAAYSNDRAHPPHAGLRRCLLSAMREQADTGGFPGPDVDEHDEGYDGQCYCRLCLSYVD